MIFNKIFNTVSNVICNTNTKLISKKLILVLTVSTAILSGCDSSSPGTSSNSGSAAPVVTPIVTPVIATNTCSAPVTKIIDYGERSTTATAAIRGAFSDIALIPGTSNFPGTVFTEAGSGFTTLKYQYWDGTKYVLEIIDSGLPTYQFVKLVYLSTGRPLVFWTNNIVSSSIYMASRNSASLTSSSTWTMTAIESAVTGITARALEASVSAGDQVGLFYVNSANNSARVILCGANCDSASNYIGMGLSTNFIAASATASPANNSADIKWCNLGTGVYYPYAVYGGTVNSLITRCTQATLASCLVPANWAVPVSITDGTNATGAGQVMTKLDISSAALGTFVVAARRSVNDIRIYKQTSGDCATGPLTFAPTSALVAGTTATSANAYGSFSREANGRSHLVVNESTTGIRYANEITGLPNTGAWTSAITETTTIAGIGVTRGGMAIDSFSDQILLTYGRTNVGTPTLTTGNIVLGYMNCPLGGTGCGASTLASTASAAGYSYGNAVLDSTGQIQLLTAQFPNSISIATTSTGKPAVAVIDFSNGSATTGRLKYKIRSGNLNTDTWISNDIGTAFSPQAVALAFDGSDRPWIAYYDASILRYFLLTNSLTDGSGIWSQYQFPIGVVLPPTLPAVNNVDLVMSVSGLVRKPLMIVSNSGSATKVIRAALFDPSAETWSNNKQVDPITTNNFSKLAADFDTAGNIVLAYYDSTASAIKLTSTSDAGATWTTPAVIVAGGAAGRGVGVDVKINPTTNRPAIAYYDRDINLVRHKYCSTAIATCNNSSNWLNQGLGIVEGSAGVSGLNAGATDGLLNASLTFSIDGYPWVNYSLGAGSSTGNLLYATTSATSLNFATSSILNAGFNSVSVLPVPASPVNFGLGGWNPFAVRSLATGSLHTTYVGPGNYLYVTSCGN